MLYHCKVFARLIQRDVLPLRISWKLNNRLIVRSASQISSCNPPHTDTADMGKDRDKDKVQFQLKTPKGTKDCEKPALNLLYIHSDITLGEGTDVVLRERIFSAIISVFKRHGAVTIDT